MTNLYILIFKKNKIIKIGKANNISFRISTLERYWGDVDYDNSYFCKIPRSEIFQVEKSLHGLLHSYRNNKNDDDLSNLTGKDGYTEIFSIDALPKAIKYLKIYTEGNETQLTKGIPKNLHIKPNNQSYNRKYKRFKIAKRKINTYYSNTMSIIHSFHMAERLINILALKQHKISFQYDVDEVSSEIILRLKDKKDESFLFSFMRKIYLNDKILFLPSGAMTNIIGSFKHSEGVTQITLSDYKNNFFSNKQSFDIDYLGTEHLKLPLHTQSSFNDDSIAIILARRCYQLLLTLPNKSSAAEENIPILTDQFSISED